MRYDVVGWYGRGNCGDDAIMAALGVLFPHAQLRFSEPGASDFNIDVRAKVILGGGDVIKPYYLNAIPNELPFSIIGAGCGYESEISLLSSRDIRVALLRNRSDVKLATEAGINAIYAPDVCFALGPSEFKAPILTPKPSRKKRLGVIMSAHAMPGVEQENCGEAAYFEYLQWELAVSLDMLSDWYEIFWISFSADVDAWDESAHYSVRRRMSRRASQTFIPYLANSVTKQMQHVSEMDLIVTMKYHGAIFATLLGVPFVAIGQTRKIWEYGCQDGLKDLVIPRFSFERGRFLEVVRVAEKDDTRSRLRTRAVGNRELLLKAMEAAAKYL